MPIDQTCDLCGVALKNRGNRLAELNWCESCFLGDPCSQMKTHRGLLLQCRAWSESRGTGTSRRTVYCLELNGSTPQKSAGLDIKFSREHIGHKIIKLFAKEIQVGDPLFDDNIYIATPTERAAKSFVSTSGIQSAVMEMVSSGGWLRILDNTFSLQMCESDPIEETEVTRSGAALLHYLDRFLRANA